MAVFAFARIVVIVFILFFKIVDDAKADCNLSLQKDFGTPSPVYIRKNDFLSPDANGAISLKRSETIQIACPGEKRSIILGNYSTSYNVLEAHCIINATFRVDRWIGEFKDIKCNRQPYFTTKATGRKCDDAAKIYGVGYQVNSKFHSLYEACFDGALLSTRYVRHHITPTSIYMQADKRPDFIEGELFQDVRMSKLYRINHQKEQLDNILGANMSSNYITKTQFLTRGHLAARADFTLRALIRASFHYVNAAPQWQRGNAGDWAALEDAIRRRVKTKGSPVTVYTGTYSTMKLADNKEKLHSIYLHTDSNNNLQVPVPMYFYKVVYEPASKTATAFVSINSSFYNKTTIRDLQFCRDVCDGNSDFSWLKWRSNDGTHSFCCYFDEFADTVNNLDDFDVKGLYH